MNEIATLVIILIATTVFVFIIFTAMGFFFYLLFTKTIKKMKEISREYNRPIGRE